MSGPGARRGLSELIPGSAEVLRPRPPKVRRDAAPIPPPVPCAPLKHSHWSWEPYVASCPACRRDYGPETAVGRGAKRRGLSVADYLRELEQRRRDNDPWLREMCERTRQIRAQLLGTHQGKA